MSLRERREALLIKGGMTLIAGMLILLPIAAVAHHPFDPNFYNAPNGYLSAIWTEVGEDPVYDDCAGCPDIKWYFANGTFASDPNKRDRVRDAFDEWDSEDGSLPVQFHEVGPETTVTVAPGTNHTPYCASVSYGAIGVVHWNFNDPDTLAVANICKSTDLLHSIVVRAAFATNTAVNWYTLGATPVPATKYDYLSTATHEIGHTVGWYPPAGDDAAGHFDPALQTSTLCAPVGLPEAAQEQTMCRYPHLGGYGKRSVGFHDRSATEDAYHDAAGCPLCYWP